MIILPVPLCRPLHLLIPLLRPLHLSILLRCPLHPPILLCHAHRLLGLLCRLHDLQISLCHPHYHHSQYLLLVRALTIWWAAVISCHLVVVSSASSIFPRICVAAKTQLLVLHKGFCSIKHFQRVYIPFEATAVVIPLTSDSVEDVCGAVAEILRQRDCIKIANFEWMRLTRHPCGVSAFESIAVVAVRRQSAEVNLKRRLSRLKTRTKTFTIRLIVLQSCFAFGSNETIRGIVIHDCVEEIGTIV